MAPRTSHIDEIQRLQQKVVSCRQCGRLVRWREQVAKEKVARFRDQDYWGKPVPGFGDPAARLLIVGLAPAAHGGNRTGRMFTGDRSGDWLYRTLHKFGFANQPISVSRDDGLELKDCYITASVRCAPPGNIPLPKEFQICRQYLLQELLLLSRVQVIIVLGRLAFDTVFGCYRELGMTTLTSRPALGHAKEYPLNDRQMLIASYHPSQQNTFTGKLTQPMFEAVFRSAKALIKAGERIQE